MEPQVLEGLLTRAEAADVISFDVFDTLFVRPLCDPEDLFDIMGARFGIVDFRQKRRAAQVRAFQTMHANGLKEITLEGIYTSFDQLPVPAQELMQAELQLELALTLPNPELIDIYVELVGRKTVVITSDMYLPRSFFDALLAKNGVPAVPLFISSERNATKRDSGELFDALIRETGTPAANILHIGDNELSDIKRAAQKGLKTFHYVDPRRTALPAARSVSASIAHALPRVFPKPMVANSFESLGFNVGGPAAFGFLRWIRQMARRDHVDTVLFTSRDGYVLERLERQNDGGDMPSFAYFKASRTALTLAATDETNFEARMSFLLSGADDLSAIELLERIGVTPPADHVMDDLGLGRDVRLTPATIDRFRSFLWACRWTILKTCRDCRAGLFSYLQTLGVRSGMRIAMVDVGWNGTTQEAFHEALKGLFDVELFGYYLCLTDQMECRRRRGFLRMDALVSAESAGAQVAERVYANRVAVELFFSAPHASVIGYAFDHAGEVVVVEDRGRGETAGLADFSEAITRGIECYGAYASALYDQIGLEPDPFEAISPLLVFAQAPDSTARALLSRVTNFDAWASSRNRSMRLDEYLV
ncbi:hydrolase [Caballeronia sp. GAOx1]|uniref:HAD family hydrolase n=1 Tax=Caballeronia sp. GAOx1 TaxID=2921761 RepID=UPI002027F9F5|nr:hydrolase [Caballeronia sp. GAOx1]